ncbi:hypothetical protein RUR49_14640 [Pseudoxanthobacter sp. M-2]|uniref:hypothetical protein n=1 Tax=Pseudoxanthobacter sp. M-2 TaxID=3078754 RepID=UPI0038FD2E56
MIRPLAVVLSGVVFALSAFVADAAQFRVEGSRLYVSGEMHGDREFERFAAMIRNNPAVKTIVMKDFYGGAVQWGSFTTITKFIRDQKLATEVDGPCVSACALAFLGGVRRSTAPGADPKRSFIGFHGIYNSLGGTHASEFQGTFVNALRRYTGGRMPEAVARKAFSLPRDGFLAFFDARKGKGKNGVSVVLCEHFGRDDGCIGITGIDGLSAGVFTH